MFFFRKHVKNNAGEAYSRPLFVFLKSFTRAKSKWSTAQFQYILIALVIAAKKRKDRKSKLYKVYNIDPEMYSILIFWKRVWKQFICNIFLCMIFQGKCVSCYISLTDQISLSDCLFFLRYWAKYVLQIFVSQVLTS